MTDPRPPAANAGDSGGDGGDGTGDDASQTETSQTGTSQTGTSRGNVARTMVTSVVRAGVPPLIGVVTLPIILGRVSLVDYGLWATITGLIAVLATIDGGLSTEVTRRVAAARGQHDAAGVVTAGREGVATAIRLALVTLPIAAIAGIPIVRIVAPPELFSMGMTMWVAVLLYQMVGWYFSLQAGVVTGLQRGDLANSVNALGAIVGALVTVAAVLLGAGVYGLLIGLYALGITTLIGQMFASHHLTGTSRVWLPLRPRSVRAMLLTGLALATLQASLLIEPAAAKAVLSALDGPESAAAVQLGYMVTRLAVLAAMAPVAAILVGVSEWRETQPERIAGLVRHAALASLALVAVLATVMLASGPYMAKAWLGITVPGIGVAIRGLSVVAIAMIVVWLFTQTLLGHGNTRSVTTRLAIGSGVSLLGMVALAPAFGLAGTIAATFLGAAVSAILLSRVNVEYAGIIWRAAARIAPVMIALGVAGALLIDALDPQGRVAALMAAVIAGVVAVACAWVLLPRDTRTLMIDTVREKFGR